jgi:hypothetical protein
MITQIINDPKGLQYKGASSRKSFMKEKTQDEVELNHSNSLESTRGFQSDLDLLKKTSDKIKKEETSGSDEFSLIGKIINSGPKNPDNCEYVRKFREIFDSGKIKPGDIVLFGKPLNPLLNIMGKLIPGNYTHTAMYMGKNEKGEHMGIEGWWPKTATGKIDSWPKAWNTWSIVRPHHTDGVELTDEERNKAVEFARSAEGCEYNLNLFMNNVDLPVDKEKTEFYCSQLAWASYYYTIGLNLDQNPDFNIKYGSSVAPQELHDSNNVSIIAEDINKE